MAGSLVTVPAVGAANWEDFITHVEKFRRGHIELSLTNYTNTSEPNIASGSVVEINGGLYQFTANESITGWL